MSHVSDFCHRSRLFSKICEAILMFKRSDNFAIKYVLSNFIESIPCANLGVRGHDMILTFKVK